MLIEKIQRGGYTQMNICTHSGPKKHLDKLMNVINVHVKNMFCVLFQFPLQFPKGG